AGGPARGLRAPGDDPRDRRAARGGAPQGLRRRELRLVQLGTRPSSSSRSAERHGLYEDWIVNQVAPWIREDSGGVGEILVTGCSFGAYHAANFALRRADLFPLGICQS